MRGLWGAIGWMVAGGVAIAALAVLTVAPLSELLPSRTAPDAAPTAKIARLCPPPLATPARLAGQPIDDVLGVRQGLLVTEAQALLLCASEDFVFEFEPVWHTPLTRNAATQRQLMHARRPGEAVVAGLVGPLGQERVASLWRDQNYGLAGAETLDAVEAALTTQYGAPHVRRVGPLQRVLIWSYAPSGAPISEPPAAPSGMLERMQAYFRRPQTPDACVRNDPLSWLAAPAWTETCGVTIHAQLDALLDAPDKISRLRVAIVDQARLGKEIEAFRASVPADQR